MPTFRHKIEEVTGDGRATWRSLNSLLNPVTDISASGLAPDALLDYFTLRIEDIRRTTKDALPPLFSSCPADVPVLAAFDDITSEEVECLLNRLGTRQCELDTAPVWLIKKLKSVFAPIISHLVNTSFQDASLPASHKRAIVRPRLKKTGMDPVDPKSYRPISNLSFISKFIERVVHRQLSSHIESMNLLPQVQSGFRKYHSTETAVGKVYNDIILSLDRGQPTALVLLDFSAAFDCVDHVLLTDLLHTSFGVTSTALDWIGSFLSNRTHLIRLGRATSRVSAVDCGVPQGSILGPLLFILYTSHITRIASSHDVQTHLYADDTQLYIHFDVTDLQSVRERLVACVSEIRVWSSSMRLSLNPSKTELIWFHRGNISTRHLDDCSLQISTDCVITPVKSIRNLGVILDSSLLMNLHISAVARSCFFHLRRIRQIKGALNKHCVRILVQALVISRLDYCNVVLAGLPMTALHPLTAVLHAAARLIGGISRRDHITPLLRQLHWLPLPERVTLKLCLLVYNILTNRAPAYMTRMISLCSSHSGRQHLRSSSHGDAVIPRTRRSFGKRAFAVSGPGAWNQLPKSIRSAVLNEDFRALLKKHFFNLTYC